MVKLVILDEFGFNDSLSWYLYANDVQVASGIFTDKVVNKHFNKIIVTLYNDKNVVTACLLVDTIVYE